MDFDIASTAAVVVDVVEQAYRNLGRIWVGEVGTAGHCKI